MKNRMLTLILVIVLLLSFASCGYITPANSYVPNDTSNNDTTEAETTDNTSATYETSAPTMILPTIEDWAAIEADRNVWWNGIYDAINALLAGDISAFEHCMGVPSGVYESFRGMVITDYKIGVEDIPYYFDQSISRPLPILTIEVAESNSDYLAPGTHELVFEEGLWMTFSKRNEMNRSTEYPRAESYISYLGSDRDFYSVWGENRRQCGLCDFIVGRLNWLSGDYEPRSEEEICEYAEKYLGVDGDTLDIERSLDKVDGGYQRIGRGGGSYEFDVLSEEVIDGINIVTVQFYADYSGIIPSRKVEFHMELLDGEYRPIKTVVLEDSDFKTAVWST